MTLQNKILSGLALALVGTLVGTGVWVSRLRTEATEAKAKAELLGQRAEVAEAQLPSLIKEKGEIQQYNSQLQADLARALARRVPTVPPAPPIPASEVEIRSQLQSAGFVASEALVLPDARMALQWHGSHVRLPLVEDALTREQAALTAQIAFTEGIKKDLSVTEKAFEVQGVALTERQGQVVQLKKANDALETKASLSVFRGNLKLVIAVPVTAFVVWKLAKR